MDPTDAAQRRSAPSADTEEQAIEARFDHSYSVVYRRLPDRWV